MKNVEINKNVKLSQHFTLGELCKIKIGKMSYYFPNFFAIY